MPENKTVPRDDPSSAPESGTNRDITSHNVPDSPYDRPLKSAPGQSDGKQGAKDDPSVANEER